MLPEARHVVVPEGIVASGFPAVRETCRSIGIEFDPWQRDLNTLVLAKAADGLLAADTVAMSICRQAGKTYDIGALVFADSIIHPGTTSVWTAHRFKVARESFDSLRAMARSPLMAPHVDFDAITTAAGNEVIPFRNGSRIVFAARERGTIRGFSKVRRLILDEGQILTESAMADLAPTLNQAHDPQIIIMGTPPKPSDPGEFFTGLRRAALEGSSEDLLYVEFGADEGSDPDDPATWAQANPSFPTRTPSRAIKRLKRLLTGEGDFEREALGIWPADDERSAFSWERWQSLADSDAERGPSPVFAVATAPDRSWCAIAVAWRRADGLAQVMVAAYRPETSWVAAEVQRLRSIWHGRLLCDTASKGVVPGANHLSEADQRQAENNLFDEVVAGTVRHGNQPELNTAVRGSKWKPALSGRSQVLIPKGDIDITPLRAAALAVHGVAVAPPSHYEDRGLLTL